MKSKGFTLIEIVVVMGVFLVMMGAAIPIFLLIQSDTLVDSTKVEMIQNLRLTQFRAMAGENGNDFGVYLMESSYVMYEGADYATRIVSSDREFSLPDNLVISGATDINFDTKTGLPNSSSTITITHTPSAESAQIQINSIGLIAPL